MARQYDANALSYLTMPNEQAFKEIASDNELSDEQLFVLKHTVRKGLDECRDFHRKQLKLPDQSAMLDCADDVIHHFDKLETLIRNNRRSVDVMTVPETVGALGRLLSFSAVSEFLGERGSDRDFRPELKKIEQSEGEAATLLKLEQALALPKERADIEQRTELFLFIICKLREQFMIWRDAQPIDVGGSPAEPFRRIMIFTLACHATSILGERKGRPAISRTGGARFIKLTQDVLENCGIKSVGDNADAIKNYFKNTKLWAVISHYNDFKPRIRV